MNTPVVSELAPPLRLLLGPGPSMVHPRVLRAMSTPLLGHLDPKFLEIMNEVQAQLRAVLRTAEPVHHRGVRHRARPAWRRRSSTCSSRATPRWWWSRGRVRQAAWPTSSAAAARSSSKIEIPWGEVCDLGPDRGGAEAGGEGEGGRPRPRRDLHRRAPADGGARQALPRRTARCSCVDTVTSLGGMPVEVDAWGVDACYSGTQKCLSCPPGLAPLTLSPRALEAVKARKTKVQSWYLDAGMVADYWAEGKRVYHHTAPISMVYALREALRLVLEEGLEARFARHRRHSAALMAGLAALGCAAAGAGGPPAPVAQLREGAGRRGRGGGPQEPARRPLASRSAAASARSRARSGASGSWASRRARRTCSPCSPRSSRPWRSRARRRRRASRSPQRSRRTRGAEPRRPIPRGRGERRPRAGQRSREGALHRLQQRPFPEGLRAAPRPRPRPAASARRPPARRARSPASCGAARPRRRRSVWTSSTPLMPGMT